MEREHRDHERIPSLFSFLCIVCIVTRTDVNHCVLASKWLHVKLFLSKLQYCV